MTLFTSSDRQLAEVLEETCYCDPFGQRRVELEARALGENYLPRLARETGQGNQPTAVRSLQGDRTAEEQNLRRMTAEAVALAERIRQALIDGQRCSDSDLRLYGQAVRFLLYQCQREDMLQVLVHGERVEAQIASLFDAFNERHQRYLDLDGVTIPDVTPAPHLFSICWQLARAFYYIFYYQAGSSEAASQLRSKVWESIFTHDRRRYLNNIYGKLNVIPTLITGESGTGKEVVAQAIARSNWIPFNVRQRCFSAEHHGLFKAVNVAALTSTLIESELFGHRRGAFTGALEDHNGYLSGVGEHGTVFLDEVAEIDEMLQVKLLRVLQERSFVRLGETELRDFSGKVVAATNRDIEAEIAAGNFREDFYYRLCADQIHLPPLRDHLGASQAELERIVGFFALRVSDEETASRLTAQALDWIKYKLPADYPWPGNFRELEQCVRAVLIRNEYRPRRLHHYSVEAGIEQGMRSGDYTAEQLLGIYCTMVYAETKNYREVARRLEIDQRTVKRHVDQELLRELGK